MQRLSIIRFCRVCGYYKKTQSGRRVCNSCRSRAQTKKNKKRMQEERHNLSKRITPTESVVLKFISTCAATPRYKEIMYHCNIKSMAHVNGVLNSLRRKKFIQIIITRKIRINYSLIDPQILSEGD